MFSNHKLGLVDRSLTKRFGKTNPTKSGHICGRTGKGRPSEGLVQPLQKARHAAFWETLSQEPVGCPGLSPEPSAPVCFPAAALRRCRSSPRASSCQCKCYYRHIKAVVLLPTPCSTAELAHF